MQNRLFPLRWAALLLLALSTLIASAQTASIKLVWDPSPDAGDTNRVAGYKVIYGLQNFTDPHSTNASTISIPLDLRTNVVVTNLMMGFTYYFSVVSVDPTGVQSDFSNLVTYQVPDVIQLPPFPDMGGGDADTNTVQVTSTTSGGGGGTTTSGGGGGGISTNTQVNLVGMLPRLWLYPTNGQAQLAIAGTVGAIFTIQSSTNPASVDSWTTITNLKLTAAAPNANTNGTSTLEKAFVPALEAFMDPSALTTNRFYRIYMPLGYAIVAQQVLTQQGIEGRLIAVRLPGIDADIVCYVTQEAAYLEYNDVNYVVKLKPSGPTIREVAGNVAASISQNWTTASEFSVSPDGAKTLFATIVRTDDPSTDPALGVPRQLSSIVIDF